MVPNDNESDVLKTTAAGIVHDASQLTPLQLAYQKQKDSVFFGTSRQKYATRSMRNFLRLMKLSLSRSMSSMPLKITT